MIARTLGWMCYAVCRFEFSSILALFAVTSREQMNGGQAATIHLAYDINKLFRSKTFGLPTEDGFALSTFY